jgi:hypothetical protein
MSCLPNEQKCWRLLGSGWLEKLIKGWVVAVDSWLVKFKYRSLSLFLLQQPKDNESYFLWPYTCLFFDIIA